LERREKDRYSARIEQNHEGEIAVGYAELGDGPKEKRRTKRFSWQIRSDFADFQKSFPGDFHPLFNSPST
jgi:hypothetical protein